MNKRSVQNSNLNTRAVQYNFKAHNIYYCIILEVQTVPMLDILFQKGMETVNNTKWGIIDDHWGYWSRSIWWQGPCTNINDSPIISQWIITESVLLDNTISTRYPFRKERLVGVTME